MLVLSRKVGEAIIVSDNIRITVVEVRGDKVRLGIVAPEEVIVDRLEVHEKRMNSFYEGPGLVPIPADLSTDLPLFAKENGPRF